MNDQDIKKFEALIYRHEDQSKLLQKMTDIDLRIIISFLTLQIVFGGFISQAEFNLTSKIGLLIIDATLSVICAKILYNNYKRRHEVIKTLENCNEALNYDKEGFYLKDGKINSSKKVIFWIRWYVIAVVVSLIGVSIILFLNSDTNMKKDNSEMSRPRAIGEL